MKTFGLRLLGSPREGTYTNAFSCKPSGAGNTSSGIFSFNSSDTGLILLMALFLCSSVQCMFCISQCFQWCIATCNENASCARSIDNDSMNEPINHPLLNL